jgi:hypothetical protein
MTFSRIELTGLLAFPLTPFTDDLDLNLDAFAEHVEGHLDAGAGALFIGCGTGEFSALSPTELSPAPVPGHRAAGRVGGVRPPLVEPTTDQLDRLERIVHGGLATLRLLSNGAPAQPVAR